jgi:hypothetical protein
MIGARLNLRLIIDGYEIPVVGARCTFTDGQPATAEIQVVATDEVYEIKPRAFVCLFYYHSGAEGLGEATSGESLSPYDPRMYKLMFMGEFVGFGFEKSPRSRGIVLQCQDATNYWDAMKQHGTNAKAGGLEMIENAFGGVNMGRSASNTATGKDLSSNIENWITASEVGGEPNLNLGIHRCIREMFFAGSIFYARQFNRLRIGDCIVGLRDDTSSSSMLKLSKFKKYLKESVARGGGQISVRKMLETLMAPILHSYVTIPCPKFDPDGASIGLNSSDMSGTDLEDMIITRTAHAGAGLNYIVIKPDMWFQAPPTCNVIFPHMYMSFRFGRNMVAEPTRFLLRTEDLMAMRSYKIADTVYNADNDPIAPPIYGSTPKAKYLKDRLYAPDFNGFDALMESNSGGGYNARLHAVEMPHEFFVGPNTAFGWEGAMGKYVSKTDRRKYLSFFADFMYWKLRFGSRQGSIQMAFNPNLIPGYGAVIIDRPVAGKKNYVGYLQQVTHSLSQQGGTTSALLLAVRPQDEDVDFDRGGRSFEEIVLKEGTEDGFFDSRYQNSSIGESVYQPLFGCDSVADMGGDSITDNIDIIHGNYASAVGNGSDLNVFANGLTHRPKATLVDIMGFNSTESWVQFPDTAQTVNTSLSNSDGFMSSAIDGDHADSNQTYLSTKSTTTVETVMELSEETYRDWTGWDDPTSSPPEVTTSVETPVQQEVTVREDETVSYQIKEDVEGRQLFVKRYVDSLLYRGLRG